MSASAMCGVPTENAPCRMRGSKYTSVTPRNYFVPASRRTVIMNDRFIVMCMP